MSDLDATKTELVRGDVAMRGLGQRIAEELGHGDVVLLHGDLGAGKTTLAQGIAQALDVESAVQSPTFTLISEYPVHLADGTTATLYHLDLYRLSGPDELGEIGWGELLAAEDTVIVVEWPERLGEWLPEQYLLISITHAGPDARQVMIRDTRQCSMDQM